MNLRMLMTPLFHFAFKDFWSAAPISLHSRGSSQLRHKVGARGFPLQLITSLGVRGGGLARFQNCSCAGGGVRPGLYETILYETLLA